ncbi:hypothetical protein CR513_28562, partial [Mucuna pruriens]
MDIETPFRAKKLRSVQIKNPDLQSTLGTTSDVVGLNPILCLAHELAPTLEEYECLLGLPLAKSPQYFFKGHYPSWASVAKMLKVAESEIIKKRRNRNGLEGI